MNDLLMNIHRFYAQDFSGVYGEARLLRLENGAVKAEQLWDHFDIRTPVAVSTVSFDAISDGLVCVRAEFQSRRGWEKELIGAVHTGGRWQIVCVMQGCESSRFACPYHGEFSAQTDNRSAIEELLFQYCHDVYIMDAEDCLSVFWDGARMYHPDSGGSTLVDVEIQILRQRWANMPDPAEEGISEFSRVCYIELLNDNMAAARIACAKLDNYFNDFLWLMKLDGKWRIVNKMTQCLYTGRVSDIRS